MGLKGGACCDDEGRARWLQGSAFLQRLAVIGIETAVPGFAGSFELERFASIDEFDAGEWEFVSGKLFAGRF